MRDWLLNAFLTAALARAALAAAAAHAASDAASARGCDVCARLRALAMWCAPTCDLDSKPSSVIQETEQFASSYSS